jgi:hypothetical protein
MTTTVQVKCAHLPCRCLAQLATNTAVKPVRMQGPKRSRLRASVTTHLARLPNKEQCRTGH